MHKALVLSCLAVLGCGSVAPLPPQKTANTPLVQQGKTARTPIAPGQAHAEILNVERLSQPQRVSQWRTWAADPSQPLLQAHALEQLAWLEDSERFSLALKGFESSFGHVRAVAAKVLRASAPSNSIRTALLDALSAATDEERGALLWTLVVHGEQSIASKALDEVRRGTLTKVTALDGRMAFDALVLMDMFSPEEILGLAKDPSATVRELVATRCAYRPEARSTDVLVELLKDTDVPVSAAAAGGLARGTNKRGHDVLLDAFRNATPEKRQSWLERVRDIAGGPGLVLLLGSIQAKPEETAWFQTKQIFDLLSALADPRAADPLVAWASLAKRHPHWLGEVGIRLAEVGDLRAAKFLADRLRLDPIKLYSATRHWESDEGGHLSRTDLPRVVAARMLADLAVVHQEKRVELLAAAEDATMAWLDSRPQPHANGVRFLATAGSTKVLASLRAWAFPKDPLPQKGATPPFPSAFETAQMGLRYIGLRRDEPSFPKLIEQLQRKTDKTLNITQEALSEGGNAMLGMALRAIGYGAAQGLAHWGDVRAAGPLMTFIEDETWHEEARQTACEALAWCADNKTMAEVARKVQSFGQSKDPAKMLIAACYAQTLALRPMPDIVPQLVEALGPQASPDLRLAYAHAIGLSGFDAAMQEKLFRKFEDPASRHAAALALILGGSPDVAVRAVATMAEFGAPALDELKDHYYRAFGYWSDLDFERGNMYRWVTNAEAMRHIEVAGVAQNWAQKRLQAQLANLRYDNGPHSMTLVILRSHLWRDAQTGNADRKKAAFLTLAWMQERGMLMALRAEEGQTGVLAQQALHQVLNPLVVAE